MKRFNPVGTLVFLTLLESSSFFGRTSALSPFLPSLCSDLGLSITQISGAYMLANLVAGLLLPSVGKCYDRTGLSDFVKAFVKIFALSFALIGSFCALAVSMQSRGKTIGRITVCWVFFLLACLFPTDAVRMLFSNVFENRRHKLWFFVAGFGMPYVALFVYAFTADLHVVLLVFFTFGILFLFRFVFHRCEKKTAFVKFVIVFFLCAVGIGCSIPWWICLSTAVTVCVLVTPYKFARGLLFVRKKMKSACVWVPLFIGCLIMVFSKGGYRHWHFRYRYTLWEYVYIMNCMLLIAFFLEYENVYEEISPTGFGCVILFLAFVGMRIAVQAYALAGRSWLATHFSKRCGFATGCVQLCVTMITALTPVICYQISQRWTCEMFFCTLSAVWFIGLFVCAFLPDKKPSRTKRSMRTATLAAMRQSFDGSRALFVFLWLTLFFRNAQNSGIAFHLVPMCNDFGVNAKTVSAAFMPISLLAVGMTFLFGHYFKRLGSRMYLGLFLLSDAGMLYAVKHIDINGMLWLFIACTGLYWGINNIIASMVIPALFGVCRIGALNGLAFGAVSLGSAVGPFYFGVMKDAASYQSALTLCIGGVLLLLCLFAFLQSRIKSAEVGA